MVERPLLALLRPGARPMHRRAPNALAADNMRQLMQLRWIAVAGQLLTVLIVSFGLGVVIPVSSLVGVTAALALANLATLLALRHRRISNRSILLALLFDLGALTVQLYLTGGARNPFISLYLLQVVLGAILLNLAAVAILVGLSMLCFGFLSIHYRPLIFPPRLVPIAGDLYTLGNWLSFALVASLLVLFMARISRNLRAREDYLAALRSRAAEEDQIVRMGLFASAAAHELGTPLASLDVTLTDWSHMPQLAADPELIGEVAEMRAEVRRCKAIITDVLQPVGQLGPARLEPVTAEAYLQSVADTWQQIYPAVPLGYAPRDLDGALVESGPALRQAIWNLLQNAAQSSAEAGIEMVATRAGAMLAVTIRDRGRGFDDEILADLGAPTTSSTGGHGVGLFLVANVARRLGGELKAFNRPEGGADVTLRVRLVPDGRETP